jgi:segregation and condensation protein A
MAAVTRQYLAYVDEIRSRNLELAAEYLLMAAMLIEIKSRMLLPPKPVPDGAEDPRAELVRRLLEYEQMKLAARAWARCRSSGATSCAPRSSSSKACSRAFPTCVVDLQEAWRDILKRAGWCSTTDHARGAERARVHEPVLRVLQGRRFVEFEDLFDPKKAAPCWWSPSSPCWSWPRKP